MAEVLLVDDDSSVLLTLSIALRRRGHDITVACDAQQALHQLTRHHYDFLVTDIRMPGMSGLELARRVQADARAPRIILTSAHYDPTIAPNPAAQVAEKFLPKPIDIEALHHLLSQSSPPRAPDAGRDQNQKAGPKNSRRALQPARFFCGQNPLPQAS